MIIFYHLKNFFLKANLSQFIKKNLQILATDMYKILNGLSPDIMQDIFETRSNYYNTRNVPAFFPRSIKTVSVDYRPSLTWLKKSGTLYLKR